MDDAETARALAEAEARLALRAGDGAFAAAMPGYRRRMPGHCPYCAGLGTLPAAGFEESGETAVCLHCEGLGDLDSARLLAAYQAGRDDALGELGWVVKELRTMLEQGAAAIKGGRASPMTADRLRSRIGG